MSKMFDMWHNEIETFCRENRLSYEKAKTMAKAWGKNDLILQYHDPEKGGRGLLDETPAPVVLIMIIQDGKPIFQTTEYTCKYLSLD